MTGSIAGVGVGPGDPELMTVKGARLIGEAEFIAYPAPETGPSFAADIARSYFPAGVEELAIRMNIGDGSYPKGDIYDQAAATLLDRARSGTRCVILCEGDPFFYGSFAYLAERLAPHFPLTIVPGISSIHAGAACAGTALVHGTETLTIVPGTMPAADMSQRLKGVESAVIMKAGRHIRTIKKVLLECDLLSRALYLERISLPEQRIMPLVDYEGEHAPYFSLILIRTP
ncbi:MAG TPA: precorrin-2 C(20)-methyltransferase [Dongiaceae bacterium]|nr:precorrin-2 C(20)-methyltransferase [Dongiaceae bacterium]